MDTQARWNPSEEKLLKAVIGSMFGGIASKWNEIAMNMPGRSAKQCNDKWK